MLLQECFIENEDGQKICTVTWAVDKTMKEYPADVVVLRHSVSSQSVMGIADIITGFIYAECEAADYRDTFRFGFPKYGGAIMEIKFTGEDLYSYDYFILKYAVAQAVTSLVSEYWKGVFKRAEELTMAQDKIDGISRAVNEDYTAECEKYESLGSFPEPTFPAYEEYIATHRAIS